MRLIDAEEAARLYDHMGPAREISGGSAANTVAGIAMLGGRTGFIGQVANDQLGEVFAHDIRSIGVEFTTPPRDGDVPTARCLILVTPDAQRTMNTFLGAAQYLPPAALDEQQVRDAAILYLEGYLWDPEEPRRAMERAIDIAHAAGRKVAFTLSDAFCISRHRDGFNRLIDDRKIDILFANEVEIKSLTGQDDFDAAVAAVAARLPLLVVTRSEKGALAVERRRARRGCGRADRPGGRHHRRRRPVRRRVPVRPCPRPPQPGKPAAGRHRRRRSDLPLRRPARSGPQGAGRRRSRLKPFL